VTGDVTIDYLERLQSERSDEAKHSVAAGAQGRMQAVRAL